MSFFFFEEYGSFKGKKKCSLPFSVDPFLAQTQNFEDLLITKTHLFKYTEKFTTKENENFQIKNSDIFHISAQNIDCGYSQSLFLSRNKKNNVYPCKPQFYYKKWGLRGSKLYRHVFVMKGCVSQSCGTRVDVRCIFISANCICYVIPGFHPEFPP